MRITCPRCWPRRPRTALPESQAGRWREAASIFVQRTRPYFSACNQLHVPRLPAIPFFERELFDWCEGLEARTDVIRDELTAILEHDRRRFIPSHSGETNARVIVHLPLIVPSGCWYRVGFEERHWKVGEALISS
jgi:aspartyl/asparaginyl beta-hydroxylase (cupin superfamily)